MSSAPSRRGGQCRDLHKPEPVAPGGGEDPIPPLDTAKGAGIAAGKAILAAGGIMEDACRTASTVAAHAGASVQAAIEAAGYTCGIASLVSGSNLPDALDACRAGVVAASGRGPHLMTEAAAVSSLVAAHGGSPQEAAAAAISVVQGGGMGVASVREAARLAAGSAVLSRGGSSREAGSAANAIAEKVQPGKDGRGSPLFGSCAGATACFTGSIVGWEGKVASLATLELYNQAREGEERDGEQAILAAIREGGHHTPCDEAVP